MTIDQVCYQQNFLSKVVLRADFGTKPLKLDDGIVAFTEDVKGVFPHSSSTPMVQLQVEMGAPDGGGFKQTVVGMLWAHTKTPAGTVRAVLEPASLCLEYGPGDYESFETFLAEFSMLLDQLYLAFGEFPFDRIGLRYVNEIRLPGKALEWEGIIREELVAATLAQAVAGGRLLRSMHQVIERHGDDQVLFNYGIFNPDYPAPAVQRFFILDIDCSRSGVVQKPEAIACVNTLNELAGKAFESSIGDGLREIMGIKK